LGTFAEIDDKSLILLIQEESQHAFHELFTRYAPRIYSFSYSYFKNKDDAQELVQKIFMKIWDKRNQIDTSQNVKSYIFRITVNAIYDSIRKRNIEYVFQNYACIHQPDNTDQTLQSVIYNDLSHTINGLLLYLPEQQRTVFNLSKMDGLTNDEISVKLNISKRTVENHLYRALAFLKKRLRSMGYKAYLSILILLEFM
jgi:RNA polymerase sigma-70 factor (ECF subfamily)